MTEPFAQHLEPSEIAAYVDGTVSGEGRAAIEAHLASCADCRAEVVDVSRIVRTAPASRGGPGRIWIPAVAAAALALWWVGPRAWRGQAPPQHREEAVTMTVAPRPIAPLGTVERATTLLWSSVPYANSYRVRLFDADGTMLWEHEATDTVGTVPDSIAFDSRRPYYWRVEAHTGFDRWAASDLVEFRLQDDAGR